MVLDGFPFHLLSVNTLWFGVVKTGGLYFGLGVNERRRVLDDCNAECKGEEPNVEVRLV